MNPSPYKMRHCCSSSCLIFYTRRTLIALDLTTAVDRLVSEGVVTSVDYLLPFFFCWG